MDVRGGVGERLRRGEPLDDDPFVHDHGAVGLIHREAAFGCRDIDGRHWAENPERVSVRRLPPVRKGAEQPCARAVARLGRPPRVPNAVAIC
ncbi:hypothetical protein Skr01_18120 [Sphaerisporangium krabiense]|nr:hypothetical protein Skr01_18120 [Sphaerisporangium krabiense]